MITRAHYHKLFSLIYLGSLILCIIACVFFEIHYNTIWSIPGLDEELLLPKRPYDTLVGIIFGLLLLLPALMTWVIAGVVRLTNSLEPLSEEQRKLSFVERMSRTQLFLPLSLLLCGLIVFTGRYYYYVPTMVIYLFVAGHFLFTWLVVLWLRGLARLKKTIWKVVCIILLLGVSGVYMLAGATFIYHTSEEYDSYWERREQVSGGYEAAEDESEDAEFENASEEELAQREVSRAFQIYDYYEGSPSMLTDIAGKLLQYDPERQYIGSILTTPEMSELQVKQAFENDRRNFDNMQHLSRFIKWFFNASDFSSMAQQLRTAMLRMGSRYNYADYAKMVDMLDMTYHELDKNYTEECGESPFWEVYARASNRPLLWENYTDIITNPYVRYLAQRNDSENMDMLMWAYTFWGRRYNDDTHWRIRQLLDIVLEEHPNTHFPQEQITRQEQLCSAAEKRAQEFLTWYKANYWSFRELKTTAYNEQGAIVQLDPEQYQKYLNALKKSGYIAPRLLKKLEETFSRLYESVPIVNNTAKTTEWLRRDPLIDTYNTIAKEFETAACRTDSIITPGESMHLTTTIDRFGILVDCIDGEWFISDFETN